MATDWCRHVAGVLTAWSALAAASSSADVAACTQTVLPPWAAMQLVVGLPKRVWRVTGPLCLRRASSRCNGTARRADIKCRTQAARGRSVLCKSASTSL